MSSSSPARRTRSASTAAAVGERQMFPVQTKSTFTVSLRGQLDAEDPLLELAELVARLCRILELQVLRVLQHALLERLHLARQLLFRHRLVARLELRGGKRPAFAFGAVDAVDEVLDALDHAFRRDAMVL